MCLSVCCLLLSDDTSAQGSLISRASQGLISLMTAQTPGTYELSYTLHTEHTQAQGFRFSFCALFCILNSKN